MAYWNLLFIQVFRNLFLYFKITKLRCPVYRNSWSTQLNWLNKYLALHNKEHNIILVLKIKILVKYYILKNIMIIYFLVWYNNIVDNSLVCDRSVWGVVVSTLNCYAGGLGLIPSTGYLVFIQSLPFTRQWQTNEWYTCIAVQNRCYTVGSICLWENARHRYICAERYKSAFKQTTKEEDDDSLWNNTLLGRL